MQELRLVAVSEDGSYAVLAVPGRSGRFALPIDERLRTVARGQFSRLAQYEIEVESPLRPKEIQDRIRAGETAEEIADAAGLPVDRIRRFEGPVLAEREFRAQEAQRATVRGRADRRGAESGPGPRLGEVVAERLADIGASLDDVEWDSRKRQDGCWQVQLAYTLAGRLYMAEWVFDPRSKHVTPDDDEAIRLCLNEDQWPEPRSAPRPVVTATVTPIGSRSDLRAEADRSGPRGVSSQPRQIPAGVAAAAGSAHAQPATPLRMPGSPAEVAAGPARGEQAAGQEPIAAKAAPESAGVSSRDADAAVVAGAAPAPAASAPAASAPAASAPAAAVAPAGIAAKSGPVAAAQAGQPDAQAQPAEQAQPARPAKRSSGGRSRRSSVPSWDEIMFGNSRQPD